jgi:hypothetical protein
MGSSTGLFCRAPSSTRPRLELLRWSIQLASSGLRLRILGTPCGGRSTLSLHFAESIGSRNSRSCIAGFNPA